MRKNLRRLLIVLLCLSFLPAFSLGESTGSDEIHLTDFTSCKDIPKLLEAADQALSAGMDPESVSDGILALADEGNFLTGFIYAAENIAAAGSENTAALEAYCIPAAGSRQTARMLTSRWMTRRRLRMKHWMFRIR